jgi:hypothetical protein
MELNEFTAKEVSPGEPITSEAWNELVRGIKAVNQFVLDNQATALTVKLNTADVDLDSVRVTALRSDGWLAQAIAPVSGDGLFVFTSLPPGAYVVSASAPGFKSASANTSIPSDDTVSLALEQNGAFMPNLVGVELASGLAMLEDKNISVGRLIDVVGRELPPAKPTSEYATQPILMQLPDPGDAVPPEGKVQIVVSAALQVDDSVEIPPLTGLTLTEARRALEAIGLKLGSVETRQKTN